MDEIQWTEEVNELIRLIRDPDEIHKCKRLMFLALGSADCPILSIQQDVFKTARRLFEQEGVYLIAVTGDGLDFGSEDGSIFYLINQKDLSRHYLGVTEINVNYDGEDLNCMQCVDTSLIEKADAYIFDSVEEYTFALTELIRRIYPEKRIMYLDPCARYFWNESDRFVCLNSIYDVRSMETGRYLYIKSDSMIHMYPGLPDLISNTFSSENVINSLCWAKNISEFGSLNKNKKILLIDCDFGIGAGLAYIVRTVCIYSIMAYERGCIPVVNLTGDNMYIDSSKDNMWEQYFKPVSDLSVDEAMKSKNVISIRNNRLDDRAIWVNPYFRNIWYQGAEFDVCLKDEIIKQFDQKLPRAFNDKSVKVLGVLVRGTDKPGLKKSKNNTRQMLEECRDFFEEGGFDNLFLATEDSDYYDAFCEEYGSKLIAIDQKRVAGKDIIGRQLNVPEGKRNEFGKTYLLITYCLSKCDAILYNFKVGAYYLMRKWRKTPFEFEYQIGRETVEHGMDNVLDCLEFIEQHEMTAIYGTGNVSERLFVYLKKLLNKVVFVDRKACRGNYLFHNIHVITPTELTVYCSEMKIDGIVLATSKYAEEIEAEIRKSGVEVKQIMRIGIQDFQ